MSKKWRLTDRTRTLLTLELAIVLPAAALMGFSIWNLKHIQRDKSVEAAIQRARAAYKASGGNPDKQFVATTVMVEIGSGGRRKVTDYFLTRGAAYLIAMNAETANGHIFSDFTTTHDRLIPGQTRLNVDVGVAPNAEMTVRAVNGSISIKELYQ